MRWSKEETKMLKWMVRKQYDLSTLESELKNKTYNAIVGKIRNLGFEKETINKYNRELYQKPEVKAYLKKPEVRERINKRQREYAKRPEKKEYNKRYFQRPEVQEKRKKYSKKRLFCTQLETILSICEEIGELKCSGTALNLYKSLLNMGKNADMTTAFVLVRLACQLNQKPPKTNTLSNISGHKAATLMKKQTIYEELLGIKPEIDYKQVIKNVCEDFKLPKEIIPFAVKLAEKDENSYVVMSTAVRIASNKKISQKKIGNKFGVSEVSIRIYEKTMKLTPETRLRIEYYMRDYNKKLEEAGKRQENIRKPEAETGEEKRKENLKEYRKKTKAKQTQKETANIKKLKKGIPQILSLTEYLGEVNTSNTALNLYRTFINKDLRKNNLTIPALIGLTCKINQNNEKIEKLSQIIGTDNSTLIQKIEELESILI